MSSRLIAAVGLFTFASILGAQTADATLTGYVNDPSGSAVPNAKVTLTNSSTAVAVPTATNQSGFYTFPYVLPGTYELSVEAPGFQRQDHPGIHVQVALSVRTDFSLQVGQAQQTVTVSGGAELIQTDNASIGTVISSREVNELPLNGRNPLSLVALAIATERGGYKQFRVRQFPDRRRYCKSEQLAARRRHHGDSVRPCRRASAVAGSHSGI